MAKQTNKKHLKENPKTNKKWEQNIYNSYLKTKQKGKDQLPNRKSGKGNEQITHRQGETA